MSTRSKLKKLFHRGEHEESQSSYSVASNSAGSSPTQPTRYEGTSPGQSPRIGQRPLSGTASPSPAVVKARQSLDRRSIDNKSLNRMSVDRPNASSAGKDRQPPVIPPMPAVNHSFEDPPAVPRHTTGVSSHSRNTSNDRSTTNFSQPLSTRQGRHSEDVADWNIMQAHQPDSSEAVPAPLNVAKRSSDIPNGAPEAALRHQRPLSGSQVSAASQPSEGNRITSASRKPLATIPSASVIEPVTGNGRRESLSTGQQNRVSLDKSLPPPPVGAEDIAKSKHLSADSQYIVADAPSAPSLVGIVDLSNTVDTNVLSTWAPAVTHEKIDREVHHIREERITREIHNHDVYHRILPIIDIEVLPARHYVRNEEGTLREITEDEIPGTSQYNQNWFVAETLSKIPTGGMPPGPRRFTAKQFTGTEGDYKEYVSEQGFPTTETTWVHPPTLATASFLKGKTTPFHFGSSDPADDGFRGPVSHMPHLYWRQDQEPPTAAMNDLSIDGASSGHANGRVKGSARGDPLTPPGTAGREEFREAEKSFI